MVHEVLYFPPTSTVSNTVVFWGYLVDISELMLLLYSLGGGVFTVVTHGVLLFISSGLLLIMLLKGSRFLGRLSGLYISSIGDIVTSLIGLSKCAIIIWISFILFHKATVELHSYLNKLFRTA